MRTPAALRGIAWLALSGGAALAQLPSTDLHVISPAWGKAGETLEVTLSGEHLDGVTGLRFSDPRATAEPVRSAPDEFFPEGQPQRNRFTVTLPDDLAPGILEVRSLGHFGLSTARPFLVLPAGSGELAKSGDISRRESAMALPLDAGARGQIESQRMDWFKIEAKQGERLFIEVWAERLDSRLDGRLVVTDAAGRELESCRGHHGRDPLLDFTPPADGEYYIGLSDILYRGGGGQYFYRIQASRGPRLDFVFPPAARPGETARFTLFGRALPGGSLAAGMELGGKPLETLEVEITAPPEPGVPGAFSAETPRQALLPSFEHAVEGIGPVRVGFATAPVILEDAAAAVQTVPVPCEIAGRFDENGDADAYRFTARQGVTYWIEAISERLGASADPVLLLSKITRDEDGNETASLVAENDDPPSFFSVNNQDAIHADTNDPVISFTPDEDGEHEVKLLNNLSSGGPAHRYRLAIREAAPDFQILTATERDLVATNGRAGYPAAPLLRQGGSLVYRVLAPRRDGFSGDITVTAEGLPPGVAAEPLVLSGDTDRGFLALTAAPDAPAWTGPIRVAGRASLGGAEVVREARNASLVWGAIFADSVRVRTRLDLETVLSVTAEETAPALLAQADPAAAWRVELNQTLAIPVKVTDLGSRKGNLTVQPHGFPGLHRNPPTLTIAEGASEGTLAIEMKPSGNFAVKPGRYQFVLQGIGLARYQHDPAAVDAAEMEKQRLEAILAGIAEEAARSEAKMAAARQALDAAKAGAAGASPASEADLAAQVARAQAGWEEAEKERESIEARAKRGRDLVAASDNALQAAAAKAKEADLRFAAYSPPITVEVLPPAAE